MRDDVTSTPQYLSAKRSAGRLDVSVTHFRECIAPHVASVDFAPLGSRKRLPRWNVDDLDRWAQSRGAE